MGMMGSRVPICGGFFVVYTTDVVFDMELVQSKQRMTEIIKHATSEEVSELF